MQISLKVGRTWTGECQGALILEQARAPLGLGTPEARRSVDVAAGEQFRGQFRRHIVLRADAGTRKLILVGLGPKEALTTDRVRAAAALVVKRAEAIGARTLALILPRAGELPIDMAVIIAAAVEGAVLASYRFNRLRTPKPDESQPLTELVLFSGDRTLRAAKFTRALREAQQVASAASYVRDLVNEPPSAKPPERMAALARELARPGRVAVKVLHRAELVKLGMGGILAVGAGSAEPPCLVHFTYRPRGRARTTVCVVGKGITFDAGGLCLKPATGMETMKDDMGGAAAVFGLFRLLADQELPCVVHGLVPLAENLPGGSAQKVGDVIRIFGGTTVEVMNTDAEGRLILADALAYGVTLKPDLVIDIATLTGACVVALGEECAGVLGTDQAAIDRLVALGTEQGELLWQLPLIERYRVQLKSRVADIKNIGKPGVAGTITAGLFLQAFIGTGIPWVHIDIAGPAFTKEELDYTPVGATAIPLRTLVAFLRTVQPAPRFRA